MTAFSDDMYQTQIIPSAEPFFFQGNKTGILLIHGFTGVPKEMRWMGEYLNQQGFACLGIRLTGHATRPEDMRRSRWQDWTASVEDGYHLLSGITERVYFVGLSMGGALSLLMSTRLDAAGVVAMSTPYQLPKDYPAWALRAYSKFVRYREKNNAKPGASWFDQAAFVEHISYPKNPARSIVELKLLLNEMQSALPNVRAPVLLIHSTDDAYVLPENMEQIYAGLTNLSDKTKLYLAGSGHIVTRDAARRQVFEVALNFIQRIERQFSPPPER